MSSTEFTSSSIEVPLNNESPSRDVKGAPSGTNAKKYRFANFDQEIINNYTNDGDGGRPLVADITTIPGESLSGIIKPLASTNKTAFKLTRKSPRETRSEIISELEKQIPKIEFEGDE